jgi:hypothetical protein
MYGRKSLFAFAAAFALIVAPAAQAGPKKKPKCADESAEAAEAGAKKPSNGMASFEEQFRDATALLYVQMEDGTMRMMCTATAFEKNGDLTRFVSAAHCLAEDDALHDRVQVSQADWYITFDDPDKKNFYPAKILAAGYQHNGDDFAVVEAELPIKVPVIPVGKKDPGLGEEISNFASPGGYGKQLFRGHISMEQLRRPLIEGEINWKGAALIQTLAGPGSSGSAVVSKDRKEIVAFIVGRIWSSPSVVAIPVSKFNAFWDGVQKGTYKWYKKDAQGGSGAVGPETKRLIETLEMRWSDQPSKAAKKQPATP